MISIKNIVESINKENQKKQEKEKIVDLTIAVTLGAIAGAVIAVAIAPKSESIHKSFNEIKEKVSHAVEIGKDKTVQLFKDSEDKLEEVIKDIK